MNKQEHEAETERLMRQANRRLDDILWLWLWVILPLLVCIAVMLLLVFLNRIQIL
jgi:hypothetical protein